VDNYLSRMNPAKCSLDLYANFLIANQNRYSGLELERVTPVVDMSHDSVTRFLANSNFVPSELWKVSEPLVKREEGYLVGDDTLLDKRYSRHNEWARVQYSGASHGLVNGICLVNLLWTNLSDEDNAKIVPVDYRVYDLKKGDTGPDAKTKNDHFRDMLDEAKTRGFKPECVLMDSWYGSIENMKHIVKMGWRFMTNLKSNRQVSVEQGSYIPVENLNFEGGLVKEVWLKEFGKVLVFRLVDQDGGTMHIATHDLSMTDPEKFRGHWKPRWRIEEFHRGIKQTAGVAKCYATRAASQKTHILAAFIAFIRMEVRRLKDAVWWYEQKASITRYATARFLATA
jgi:putative transposase